MAPTSSFSDGQRFWLDALQAVEELDHRGARVGLGPAAAAVDADERIRLFRAGRQDAARPVILERAADEMDAVGEQRRGERVAVRSPRRPCRRR